MTDTEKLFICECTGCNMSFTNEDQLMVHKKKHDMMLNLSNTSKNGGFIADQTPTPTRFIRNCEEVGLFQDLQNVNPFDETFRRAVESGNTSTLSVSEAGLMDDTLHTPHIFPHIADVLSGTSQILPDSPVQECSSTISITDKTTTDAGTIETAVCASVKLTSGTDHGLLKDIKLTTSEKVETLNNGIISHSQNSAVKILPEQVQPQLSINGEEVQLLLKTADGKVMQLSAIPVAEGTGINALIDRSKQQHVVIRTDPPLQSDSDLDSSNSRLSLARMKLKQVLSKHTIQQHQSPVESCGTAESSSSKKENRPKSSDLAKRKDIRERNRASSMRARARRKAWVQELERTVTNVNETNAALQIEIKALRGEVAKLKTLLLAHKDCSVSKAMYKGTSIVVDSKALPISPEVTSTLEKRHSTSYPHSQLHVASKKQLLVTSTKNPVIFPKVECGTLSNATLLKSLPTLKILNVNQFITEKEEGKQILIVHDTSRKLQDPTHRQIIQINPNYEIDDSPNKTSS